MGDAPTREWWTKEQVERLRELASMGKTIDEAAAELCKTTSSVTGKAYREKIKFRARNQPWDLRDEQMAVEMSERGATVREIADATGRSVYAVRKRLALAGVRRSSASPAPTVGSACMDRDLLECAASG